MTAARKVANLVSETGTGIASIGTTNTPLTIQAFSGQTADLLQVKNSSGSVMSKIDAAGEFVHPGTILQVLQTTKTDVFSTSSTTYVDVTGLSVSITPRYSNSKILVMGSIALGSSTVDRYSVFGRLMRGSTPIHVYNGGGNYDQGTFSYQMGGFEGPISQSFTFLDSPSTISETIYKVQIRAESPQSAYVNRGLEGDGNSSITPRVVSSITLMEVAQ